MVTKALIITGQTTETDSRLARNLISVGGITLLRRQLSHLAKAGITDAYLITDWYIEDYETEIALCDDRPENIQIIRSKDAPNFLNHALQMAQTKTENWLIIEEGVLTDERILKSVIDHPENLVISALKPDDHQVENLTLGIELEEKLIFASVAKLPAAVLFNHAEDIGKLDLFKANIKKIYEYPEMELFDIAYIPLFIPHLRSEVPLTWMPLSRQEDALIGTKHLIKNAQTKTLEAAEWYFYRPIQNLITQWLSHLAISPVQISCAKMGFALLSLYLFAVGQNYGAIFSAFFVGILQGVHEKTAEINLRPRKLGRTLFLFDKIVPVGWYLAIAFFLTSSPAITLSTLLLSFENALFFMGPYFLALAIGAFRAADEMQCEFFRRLSGKRIYDMTPFDQKTRLFGGHRNNLLLILLTSHIAGYWFTGFILIGIYSIATFFIHQVRIMSHTKSLMEANSSFFTNNFKKTKIF